MSTDRPRCDAARSPAPAMVAAGLGFVLLILSSPVIAQHEPFVDALTQFTAALPGAYGDEAAAARASLERMERGLAEWDKTLREYQSNILTIGPTAAPKRVLDMHRAMGMLSIARGRFDDAAREFDAAVALSPEPLLHLFRGRAYEAAGKPAEAIAAYTSAWTLDRANPVAAYTLAEASFRSGSSPPPGTLAALSDVVDRIAAGQYSGERDPFVATVLVPDDLTEAAVFVPWWYSAAYARLKRGEFTEAVGAMRAAAAQDPFLATPTLPALLRSSEALRVGQVERAIDQFAEAVRHTESSQAHQMLGVAYWLSADDERSIEHLERAVRLNPMDERARVMLARVLEEIGETERAERQLSETVKAIPSSARAHSRLGRIYAASNRTKDAVREYEAAVRIGMFAGEAPLLLALGELHRKELDSERAEAVFARAVALRPNDAVGHRERGSSLLQLARPEAAFVELAAALLLDSGDYESYLAIGQIHLDAGRYSQAVRLLARAIEIRPDEPEPHFALATALLRSGRDDEAARHRETFGRLQAVGFEKKRRRIESSTTRFEASDLTEKLDFEGAVAAWTKILADGQGVAADYAALAAALVGRGQLEAAAAQYEKALGLDAGASVYRQLAALYNKMGRPDGAAATRAKLARTRQAAFGLAIPRR